MFYSLSTWTRNLYISFILLLISISFNPVTWILFFDDDGFLILSNKLIFLIINIFCGASSYIFFKNKNKPNYYKYFLKILAVNLVILFFMLKTVELIFGEWVYENPWYHKSPVVKNQSYEIYLNNLYPSENDKIRYNRDEYGFRGNYDNISKINILTIGGSTTDQKFVDDSLIFENFISREFSKKNQKVSVANAGIDGQSTIGHLNNFYHWFPYIKNLKVEYFLFYIGINDFHILSSELPDFRDLDLVNLKNRPNLEGKDKKGIKYFILELFNIVDAIYYAKREGLYHGKEKRWNFSKNNLVDIGLIKNYEKTMKKDLKEYEKRLELLCEEVIKLNAKAIFVSQGRNAYKFIDKKLYGVPDFGSYKNEKINGVDYYKMIRLMHEKCKNISERNNMIFIDLQKELTLNYDQDFYDDMHTTPSGSMKIGKYIYSKTKHLDFKLK